MMLVILNSETRKSETGFYPTPMTVPHAETASVMTAFRPREDLAATPKLTIEVGMLPGRWHEIELC